MRHWQAGGDWKGLGRGAVLALAFALVVSGLSFAPPAFAQQRDGSSGSFLILRQLFSAPGERRMEKPRKQKTKAVKARKKKPRKKQGAATAAATRKAPAPPVAAKSPDAKVVLVVGDFLAAGLAEGLEDALADEPALRVVDRTDGSSGLVRDDVVDWPKRVGELIEEEKPAAVVAMLGSNDRQAMRVEGASVAPRDPVWTIAYEDRAERLGEAVSERKVPLLWVGLPAFKSPKMSADILAFNDIHRAAAESAGGEFIDVWEGFVDESGAFSATGPDVNGQPARLRGSDGVNVTRAGKRKLAFYVEKPLQKALAGPASPAVAALAPAQAARLAAPAASTEPVNRTEPIALGAPALGEDELLSVPPQGGRAAPPVPSSRPSGPVIGRADDFTVTR